MKLSKTQKILSLILTVLLIMAPIEASLSGDIYSHLALSSIDSADSGFELSAHHHSKKIIVSDHLHGETHEVDENSCQSQCANCVYCSAANVMSSTVSLSVYESVTPEVTMSRLKSVDVSVDIRPPI